MGNIANVPCLSLALLAFTSQVLSSLQRSGGMYPYWHSSTSCSHVVLSHALAIALVSFYFYIYLLLVFEFFFFFPSVIISYKLTGCSCMLPEIVLELWRMTLLPKISV